jgi:HKD family nuclease
MKKNFILQGVTPKTHAEALRKLFSNPNIEKIILSVAFISENGVKQIEDLLRQHADRTIVFAGVRNDITSYQGLLLLHNIGVKLYIVDTGSRAIIFHPKIYLASSQASANLVIGSANLTLGGLNNNIEAGIWLDFDLTDPNDKALFDDIESQLAAMPAEYPQNIISIGNVSELDRLLESGRLVDESIAPPPRPVQISQNTGSLDSIPRIKLKGSFQRQVFARSKVEQQKPVSDRPLALTKDIEPHSKPIGIEYDLVWESKPLTERDLNIPHGTNTHATGSMNMDKGLLAESVDHRHYFRDEVFPHLTWLPKSKTVDEAYAKFQLILKGISYGEFDLAIRHTTTTDSAAYQQRNAMTRLSWGSMRKYVAKTDLIGRTLRLYRDQADPTRFVLEID